MAQADQRRWLLLQFALLHGRQPGTSVQSSEGPVQGRTFSERRCGFDQDPCERGGFEPSATYEPDQRLELSQQALA